MIFRTGGAQQIVSKGHTYFIEGQCEARPALATTADHLDALSLSLDPLGRSSTARR